MKKKLLSILLVICMLLTACGTQTKAPEAGKEGEEKVVEQTVKGFKGDIKVKTTFDKDGKIAKVEVLENEETENLGGVALKELSEAIVKENSVAVDAKSGATVTSDALVEAVKGAIKEAGYDEKDYQGGAAAPKEGEEPAEGGAIKAGTYKVESPGMNDKIEMEVELTDKEIKDIKIIKHSETPGIGGELKNSKGEVVRTGVTVPTVDLVENIIKEQSLEVDDVTGATISSMAIKRGVEDAIKQAGGDPAQFKKEVEKAQDKKDLEADVVIIGGGGTGLAAAVTSAQQGKTVVVIEKNGAVGGNTLVCGAIYNTPNPDTQKDVEMTAPVKETIEAALAAKPVSDEHKALIAEVKAQWDKYKADKRTDLFDTKEWYALQTWNGGDNVAKLGLVETLTYKALDGFNWIKELGMGFKEGVGQGAGSLWQRTHTSDMDMGTGFIATYSDQVVKFKDKIEILLETTAENLVLDGDKVVGVEVASNSTGQKYKVTAKNGVIITTGGFSANSEMVQNYNTSGKWADLSKVPTTNRETSSQGDGINLGLQAKAGLTDMEQIQLLYLGNTQNGQLTKYPPRDVNGTDQIIFINKEGKRFVREDGRRDDISKGVLDQTDQMFYMLESGDGDKYVDINDPNWRSADGFTFDYLKENGYILVGETLEDIAKEIGCDPAALQETVDKFNESVDSGKDEFGRTLFSTKLEKGPWVATSRQASVHHTMGGLSIDPNGRVLNEGGDVIVGLYAAGEVTGGVHGANRLGGNAVVDTVVFGKEAADTLIKDIK